MMKRIFIGLVCILVLLTGCTTEKESIKNDTNALTPVKDDLANASEDSEPFSEVMEIPEDPELDIFDITDTEQQQMIADRVLAQVESLDSESFEVENINITFFSDEYLEELEYNSKANIYFGYTLEELRTIYKDTPYIFTYDGKGNTTTIPFDEYNDKAYEVAIKNIAVGSGAILISGTALAIMSSGTINPVTITIAIKAGSALKFALNGALIGGLIDAAIKGYMNGDMEGAVKNFIEGAGYGFEIAAIVGSLVDLASVASYYSQKIPSWSSSEQKVQTLFGGEENQVAFLNKERVATNTFGSTRPDVVRTLADGTKEAIEVKRYDLINNISNLKNTLYKQLSARISNLPDGFRQRVVFDATGRKYSMDFLKNFYDDMLNYFNTMFPGMDIGIDIVVGNDILTFY